MSVIDMSVSSHLLDGRSAAVSAERGPAATRAQLRQAGQALFAERGLHGVTTHDIARAAGVAAGTFYLHYPDKRALFAEIAHHAIALLRQRLETATAPAPDLRSAVPALSKALVAFAEEHREIVRILFSRDRDAAAVEADVLDELARAIAQVRRARIENGQQPAYLDPDVLSQAMVGMWARVLAWWSEDPSRATRQSVIDTLVRIQLSGTHPASNATRSSA